MRASVDPDLCTGCGLCESTCPEVFTMEGDGDIAVALEGDLPDSVADTCQEAADGCPVEAITVD